MGFISEERTIRIYTDGSSSLKTNTGGWAYVAMCRGVKRVGSGGVMDGKTGGMELTAIVNALRLVKPREGSQPYRVVVNSDSQYAVNSLTRWWMSWQANNWFNSQGEPVKNRELIQEALAEVDRLDRLGFGVMIQWVKGHAGNEFNEEADKLAGEARLALLDKCD